MALRLLFEEKGARLVAVRSPDGGCPKSRTLVVQRPTGRRTLPPVGRQGRSSRDLSCQNCRTKATTQTAIHLHCARLSRLDAVTDRVVQRQNVVA